jgi:alpha-ribazole phosphatase
LLKPKFQKKYNAVMKANTHIDLLRHGETVGGTCFRGSTNDPLTELGWAQLWDATDENGSYWDRVITSPLGRCADFAQSLGQKHSIQIARDERFQELHFGTWEGRSAEELMKTDADALSQFWNDPVSNTPPQGESLMDFERRVLSGWKDILSNHMGEKILLITHGGVIRLLLCHILQRPLQRLLEFEIGHATIQQICVEHTPKGLQASLIETKV